MKAKIVWFIFERIIVIISITTILKLFYPLMNTFSSSIFHIIQANAVIGVLIFILLHSKIPYSMLDKYYINSEKYSVSNSIINNSIVLILLLPIWCFTWEYPLIRRFLKTHA